MPKVILTEAQWRQDRNKKIHDEYYRDRGTMANIARRYGLTPAAVQKILRAFEPFEIAKAAASREERSQEPSLYQKRLRHFSAEVKKLFVDTHLNYAQIAQKLGVSSSVVYRNIKNYIPHPWPEHRQVSSLYKSAREVKRVAAEEAVRQAKLVAEARTRERNAEIIALFLNTDTPVSVIANQFELRRGVVSSFLYSHVPKPWPDHRVIRRRGKV